MSKTAQRVATDCKVIATHIARLELTGHTMHQEKSGRFLVTLWGVSRVCMDVESPHAFADQVGMMS